MERRAFVKSGALALVTMGLSPTFLRRTAFGMELFNAPKGKVLICLFQRGAADALNIVVPHGEKAYYAMRPSIAIPQPSRNAIGGAIDLDGFFGLHPALAPLKPLYDRKLLAAVHAVGSPSTTRSHFDAQDYMETGTPDNKGTADGWLNRPEELKQRVLSDLRKARVLSAHDEILFMELSEIPFAYVIFDHNYESSRKKIFELLAKHCARFVHTFLKLRRRN